MSEVAPISRTASAGLDAPNTPPRVDAPLATPQRTADRAEFSHAAQLLSRLADLPVRENLVDRIRTEIANGTYDSPDKIDALLDNLAEDIIE